MELLAKYFDTAFAAPGGIQKLRELILTLAMQGKLVAQNPKDPPASELLKEVDANKKRLVKDGKIKKAKLLPEIKPEEVPYDLPQGWEWVRLGNIGEINPRIKSEDEMEAGFVPMPLIFSEYGWDHKFEIRKWGEIKKGHTHFKDDDVGLAKITPCFENAKSCVFKGLPNGIGAGTTELHIFRNTFGAVYPKYLLAYIKNPRYIAKGALKMTGSAGQKRVPKGFFSQNPFPLPPLPEQHRIVAKIDQLMARCDELEKLRTQRDDRRLQTHAAAINKLLDAADRNSSSSAWHFIRQHFGDLYSVKDNVAELREAILQLAVMGRLVPQAPKDPPASELLKEIEAEKRRLVKDKKIKKPRPLPEIKPEEVPYELPQGWECVRLGDLISQMDAGWSPKCENGPASDGTWGVLKTTAVQPLQFRLYENKALPSELDPRPAAEVKEGDLLITRAGPKNRVGICCVAKPVRSKLMLSDKLIRFKIIGDYVFPEYCALYLNTGFGAAQIDLMKSGMAESQMNISQAKVKQIVMLIPPLPEQRHIVFKVDQLISLCDDLENQIETATVKQGELLDAVTAQV